MKTWLIRIAVAAAGAALLAAFGLRLKAERDADLAAMEALTQVIGKGERFTFRPLVPAWAPEAVVPRKGVVAADRAGYAAARKGDCFAALDRLEGVEYAHVPLTGRTLDSLANCPRLKWIKARSCAFHGDAAQALAACRQLELLDFECNDLREVDFRPLAALARLKEIRLGWTKTPDAQLAAFAGSTTLAAIDLQLNPTVTGEFLNAAAVWPALEELDFHCTAVDDGLPATIAARCPNLRRLDLSYAPRLDAGAAALGGMAKLETLSLRLPVRAMEEVDPAERFRGVGDDAVRGIAQSTSLVEIDLDGTQVTGAGLLAMAAIPTLRRVSFQSTSVAPADVAEFRRLRPDVSLKGPEPAPRRVLKPNVL